MSSSKNIQELEFNNKFCNSKMKFQDCELAIVKGVISDNKKQIEDEKVMNQDIKKLISIVENFIRRKKLICYGGIAINNILPKYDKFYGSETKIPDYDFYSPNPIEDSRELADLYYKNGYRDVEAKSGVHFGTYKVFVNYISIADITFLHNDIYKELSKEAIQKNGIYYAPPNFLRMSIYSELSRPKGEPERWEKIIPRLHLLNKHHPLVSSKCSEKEFNSKRKVDEHTNTLIRNTLIDNGVVFFGGYATLLYSKYVKEESKNLITTMPDYDVISDDIETTARILKETLKNQKEKYNVAIVKHKKIGEIIGEHIEIKVNNKSIVYIYSPIACHNYNKLTINGKEINVATIDTILSLYFAFISIKSPNYSTERLICLAEFYMKLLSTKSISQKNVLKRFEISCVGKQKSLSQIKNEKASKYKEFKQKNVSQNAKEYQMWFFRYIPGKQYTKKNKTQKKKMPKRKSMKIMKKGNQVDTVVNNFLI